MMTRAPVNSLASPTCNENGARIVDLASNEAGLKNMCASGYEKKKSEDEQPHWTKRRTVGNRSNYLKAIPYSPAHDKEIPQVGEVIARNSHSIG